MPSKGIMEVCSKVPFDILVCNLANIPVHVPKDVLFCAYGDSMINIIDPEQVYKERRHTVATVQATSNRHFR